MPLPYFDQTVLQFVHNERSLIPYNIQLTLQAAGLGGWLFGGINSDALLGAFSSKVGPYKDNAGVTGQAEPLRRLARRPTAEA